MNIMIVEQLLKANKDSVKILKSIPEQSLKRRIQIEEYNKHNINPNNNIISNLVERLKTYWYC